MAKGLRSKKMKRMRTAKRQHYWEVEGKYKLQEMSDRLMDPNYKHESLPPNAYLNPSDPAASFPQWSKPHIIDFRSEKMAMSGLASRHVFRKHLSDKSKKSKFPTIIKLPADIEREEEEAKAEEQRKADQSALMDEDDDEIDLAKCMDKQMKISKPVPVVKAIKKPEKGDGIRAIKEKRKNKKNRSQLKF